MSKASVLAIGSSFIVDGLLSSVSLGTSAGVNMIISGVVAIAVGWWAGTKMK